MSLSLSQRAKSAMGNSETDGSSMLKSRFMAKILNYAETAETIIGGAETALNGNMTHGEIINSLEATELQSAKIVFMSTKKIIRQEFTPTNTNLKQYFTTTQGIRITQLKVARFTTAWS